MSAPKWGESFLKSGLPLEHLTAVTLRNLKWAVRPQEEYSRRNREDQEAWFELDLVATYPLPNLSTELSFLVECKYHDLSRHWFFLPHESSGRWAFDDRVFNCGPYHTLKKARANTLLPTAPLSTGGIVVSADGTKQDNAVHSAVEQLVNAFVPYSLRHMFTYSIDFRNVRLPQDEVTFEPIVTALVPMIVTNARLYRLKPDVSDLDEIRKAKVPNDIADELDWTWHYYDVPMRLIRQNYSVIDSHVQEHGELIYHFPNVDEVIKDFAERPNWIAVVNIKALSRVATMLQESFSKLETTEVAKLIRPQRRRRNTR